MDRKGEEDGRMDRHCKCAYTYSHCNIIYMHTAAQHTHAHVHRGFMLTPVYTHTHTPTHPHIPAWRHLSRDEIPHPQLVSPRAQPDVVVMTCSNQGTDVRDSGSGRLQGA